MYEQKEEQTTYVQVHTVPGMFDYINFQAGVPLTFHNCHNKNGFKVNGKMDALENELNKEFCHWEMVTGDSGTFLRTIGNVKCSILFWPALSDFVQIFAAMSFIFLIKRICSI